VAGARVFTFGGELLLLTEQHVDDGAGTDFEPGFGRFQRGLRGNQRLLARLDR
jgi:hypothetical protein